MPLAHFAFHHLSQTFPDLFRNTPCVQGVECDKPGTTLETLPVGEGYWRGALDTVFIRKCPNEVCLQHRDDFNSRDAT